MSGHTLPNDVVMPNDVHAKRIRFAFPHKSRNFCARRHRQTSKTRRGDGGLHRRAARAVRGRAELRSVAACSSTFCKPPARRRDSFSHGSCPHELEWKSGPIHSFKLQPSHDSLLCVKPLQSEPALLRHALHFDVVREDVCVHRSQPFLLGYQHQGSQQL